MSNITFKRTIRVSPADAVQAQNLRFISERHKNKSVPFESAPAGTENMVGLGKRQRNAGAWRPARLVEDMNAQIADHMHGSSPPFVNAAEVAAKASLLSAELGSVTL